MSRMTGECKIHGEEFILAYTPINIKFPLSREDEELPIQQMTFEVSEVCKKCYEENE